MIESLNKRWAIVIFSLVAAAIYLTPNFVDVGESWVFSKSKLNYGLDIQGGLHLVMGVDVNGVIEEKSQRLVANLPSEMEEQAVTHGKLTLSEDKRSVSIAVSSQAESDGVVKFLNDFYPNTLQVLDNDENVVEIQYYDAKIQEYKDQVVNQAIEVIRNRIDEFGVSEPSIAAQGDNRIIVQLPGLEDAARAKDLINRTAQLYFRIVSDKLPQDQLIQMVEDAEKAGGYALGQDDLGYSAYLKRINEDLKTKVPENTMVVFQKNPAAVNLEAGKVPYLVSTVDSVSGGLLEDAFVRPDESGRPQVGFRFGVEGKNKFGKLTGDNVNKPLAIVLDGVLQSAPIIESKITDSGVINLGGRNYQETLDEANFIATTLRAGALPAALEQLEERTVGPTLGADSIAKGKLAGMVGGVLVLVFMFLYYRGLGMVANLSLCFNIMLILAILTSLGATLTLPGVAGIVLTVGMAVDANVIIFERIKEELRKGAGLKIAVKDGFGHAFSAIFDANITTAAVCVVLMYFGTGPVRGFAVTLIIGILTSMFTAIFVSRAIIDLLTVKFKITKIVKA